MKTTEYRLSSVLVMGQRSSVEDLTMQTLSYSLKSWKLYAAEYNESQQVPIIRRNLQICVASITGYCQLSAIS